MLAAYFWISTYSCLCNTNEISAMQYQYELGAISVMNPQCNTIHSQIIYNRISRSYWTVPQPSSNAVRFKRIQFDSEQWYRIQARNQRPQHDSETNWNLSAAFADDIAVRPLMFYWMVCLHRVLLETLQLSPILLLTDANGWKSSVICKINFAISQAVSAMR